MQDHIGRERDAFAGVGRFVLQQAAEKEKQHHSMRWAKASWLKLLGSLLTENLTASLRPMSLALEPWAFCLRWLIATLKDAGMAQTHACESGGERVMVIWIRVKVMVIIEVMEMDDDKYDGVTLVTKQG